MPPAPSVRAISLTPRAFHSLKGRRRGSSIFGWGNLANAERCSSGRLAFKPTLPNFALCLALRERALKFLDCGGVNRGPIVVEDALRLGGSFLARERSTPAGKSRLSVDDKHADERELLSLGPI